jgi:1-acyl-sn-glycerol-3-phosphate acyltransferase
MRRPGVRIGKLMDFSRYAGARTQRDVLRYVTDEIMNAVMVLSGQDYVDAYGTSVKAALEEGRTFPVKVVSRPGEGRQPPALSEPAPPGATVGDHDVERPDVSA